MSIAVMTSSESPMFNQPSSIMDDLSRAVCGEPEGFPWGHECRSTHEPAMSVIDRLRERRVLKHRSAA